MAKPIIGSRTVKNLRKLSERGYALTGQGGDRWTVTRLGGGDTISGPIGPTTVGTITGYAYREQSAQLRPSEPAVPVADAPWRFAVVDAGAIALKVGDTLTSAADSSLVFTITGLDRDVLFQRALIDPR